MKIKQSDIEVFKQSFLDWRELHKPDLDKHFTTYKKHEFTPKRARWDIMWALPSMDRNKFFNSVHKYANDSHVDTMLKNLILNDKWEDKIKWN